MTRPASALAVDVGGTSAKIALIDARQRIFRSAVIPTGRDTAVAPFVKTLSATLNDLKKGLPEKQRIAGIGVGVPGPVDHEGVVQYLVNMPRWREVHLKDLLQRQFRLPVRVDNDVKAMAWGEYRWGAGRGAASLFCMMLGTGVGGGWIIGGRLYRGWTFSAGEIGHTPLALEGPPCPCGGRACLERSVGNREIVLRAARYLRRRKSGPLWKMVGGNVKHLTPRILTEAARRKDAVALRVWNEVGQHVGLALTAVVNVFNPERIVIGGGVAQAGPFLFRPIRRMVRARAMRGPANVQIVPARWGAQAGLIGAAAMVLSPESSKEVGGDR
ncbi:MAG: ROK family protein [Candidatus Omnitrophica bacterium]|nr:ROK family protein [Candidatus Omnitrophota bacterium]